MIGLLPPPASGRTKRLRPAGRLPQAHLRLPRRGEYSRETWQPGKRLEDACSVE